MIQSDRIKKMLHILKTNINDLNVHVTIIDYDIEKLCDYEQLTLHLKESYDSLSDLEEFLRQTINELNNAGSTESSENTSLDSYISDFVYILDNKNSEKSYVIYKDFIIRSQLYYDTSEDKYLSALDGDIIVIDKALPKISIITNLTKLSLLDDYIDIEATLIDADTLKPIKQQALSLYLSSAPDTPVAHATTDKTGTAIFHFDLKDSPISVGDNIMHIEYKGNKTYRAVQSSPILVNIGGTAEDDNHIKSNLSAELDTSSKINLTYKITFDNKNLANGFREYSGLNISDTQLLNGDVLFYINNILIGQAETLVNDSSYSYASIKADLPEKFYDAGLLNVQAIFQGNDYFVMNIANTNIQFSKYQIDSSDISFTIEQPNIEEQIYHINFSFCVNKEDTDKNKGILNIIKDATGNVGFIKAFLANGLLDLYLYDNNHDAADLVGTISAFNVTEINTQYIISAQPKIITLDSVNYNITEQDAIRIKGKYHGNTVIKTFEVDATTNYYFTGVITKNDSSAVVANAKVALYDTDEITASTMPLKEAISDNAGKFVLMDIAPGIYTIIISQREENYTDKILSSFYITRNIKDYNIHLYKRGAA